MNKTDNRFDLVRCSSDFLSASDFEDNFYENSGSVDHCMENNWVHL